MFRSILVFYLVTCMITLVGEMLVVMRQQANNFPIMRMQLFCTVFISILPIYNLWATYQNIIILFAPKEIFVKETHELRQSMNAMFDAIDEMKDDR